MCTVIIHVPEPADAPVRLLAVRDEDPGRPWDRVGAWWPDEYPGVVGVRDARAGGAWLAADPASRRLAVLLNRLDLSSRTDDEVTTRGAIALDAVAGRPPGARPSTRGFNLVEVSSGTARVVSWNGLESRSTVLAPGTHMIAHDEVDDPGTARIAAWLDGFRARADRLADDDARWWAPWLELIGRSAELDPTDDRAIIRRQSFLGMPSLSLLLCAATIGPGGVQVRYAELDRPGQWGAVDLG